MITTYIDFEGDIAISNSDPSLTEGVNLGNLINKYEAKCLEDVLGYKLADLLQTNINQGSGVYHDLLNGKTYVDINGYTQYWKGFRETGFKPLANYIYCQWHKQNYSQTTSMGERSGKFENMTNANPAYKFKEAWNNMVDMFISMDEFITVNKVDYENYIGLVYPIDGDYNMFTRLPSNINYFKKVNMLF